MSSKQQAFLDLFRAYMRPGGAEKPLFDFVDKLSADDLADCTRAYFDEDEYTYRQQRPRSLVVFVRLARGAIKKNVYAALHVEAQIQRRGSPWQTHFDELRGQDKNQLAEQIKKAKGALPYAQREFIEKFKGYMSVPRRVSQQQIQKFTEGVKRPEDRQGCVRVYIEISQSYPQGNDADSLLIFFGLSFVALQVSGFAYAYQYESSINERGSVWQLRFASLDPDKQRRLRQQIASAKVLRNDVAVDDPAHQRTNLHRNAPIGKAQMAASPIDKAHPEDELQEKFSAVQSEFVKVYRAYVDSKGDRKRMDELQTFLRKHKGDDVRACVIAYLKDSARHYPGKPSDESRRVFFGVLADALAKNPAYYASKVRILLDTQNTIWNERYLALDKLQYRDRLDERIAEEIRTKNRLIDEVKTAYFLKHRKDPTVEQLRDFDPASAPELETQVAKALTDVEVATAVKNIDGFDKAFKTLSDILSAQTDRLTLMLLVKRCFERKQMNARYRHLIYLYGVGLLFIQLVRKYPERYYRSGFNAEEKQWLFEGPQSKDRYFIDFATQLECAISKNQGADAYYSMTRGHAVLQIYSDQLRLTLTPLLEAATLRGAVETAWQKKAKEVSALRIHVAGPTIGAQQLYVNQTFGNYYILWWDQQRSTVYLQVNGLEQTVFETGVERLAQLYADYSFYGVVYENTAHLLELIPFIYEILGFIPDLVSGGVTGLIKSIVFSYAFDKSMQALGIDPTKAQLVLLGASLLLHGLHPKGAGAKPAVDTEGVDIDAVLHDVPGTGVTNRSVDVPLIENAGHDVAPNLNTATESRLLDTPMAAETRDVPTNVADDAARSVDGAGLKTEVPVVEPPLASREGIDMRGPELGDGQHGIGLHENAEPKVDVAPNVHEEGPTVPLEGNQERAGLHADDPAKDAKFTNKERGIDSRGKDDPIGAHKKSSKKTKGKKSSQGPEDRELINADEETGGEHKKRAASSKKKDRSRSKGDEATTTKPKASAPPPPPLPPPQGMSGVRERMPGTWRQEGRLHVNENGYALKEPVASNSSTLPGAAQPSKVSQARVHGPTYEQACNQQVFPDMAEHLSDKPVRIDEKHQLSGYRTPSSTKTSRLKLQKGMQSEGFKRTPDASMEIVQKVDGRPTVVENDLFEATIDPDFSSAASRKRVQSAATTWMAGGRTGPRYAPNTRTNYHIVAPDGPNRGSIAELNKLAAENPNLEIFWYVVR